MIYHPSQAGLYVHGQKLADLFNRYPPDNVVSFDKIPIPNKGTIDRNGEYHELVRDEWGTTWNCRIFGVAGHPKVYPFNNWEEAVNYKFPSISAITSSSFESNIITSEQKEKYLIFNGWISIFERLHGLRPFEEVLTDILISDPHLMNFLDELVKYWIKVIDYIIAIDTDVVVFADDWGTQRSPLIPPDLFREIFKPLYSKLFSHVKNAGKKVFLHCCGFMDEILDDFIDLGINGIWPQITLYENDGSFFSKCKDNRVAFFIHPDRQYLIPRGTPDQIEDYIQKCAKRCRELGGGGIFYVEVENDAPFENVKALVEAIDRFR